MSINIVLYHKHNQYCKPDSPAYEKNINFIPVDQIGGPDRKTFKTKRLKELLLEISGLTMCEQRSELERKIKEWQGALDQIDDILVVGMKILD